MKNLWFNSVSLEDNEDYIYKLCRKFKINNYNAVYESGQLCLLFEVGIDTYKCSIDKKEQFLILLKKNKSRNLKHKEFYHVIKKFPGHDCWYDMFKFIMKQKQ